MELSKILLKWYQNHKRELPWRDTKNPYNIWISEIILQQTRVAQGMQYYLNFIKKFPDIKTLAKAKEDEVMNTWKGLGYYNRAKNLHTTARQIYYDLKNSFPDNYKELLHLKGIGQYTAAAIASLAFNESVPALDGNVYRVLSRYFGIDTPMDSSKAKSTFYTIAMDLIDKEDPGTSNQTFIELGALICTPKNPKCDECPIHKNCFAYNNRRISSLPVKNKSSKNKKRYFYYLIIQHNGKIAIRKRNRKDIWNSLYEFPLIETPGQVSLSKLMNTNGWTEFFQASKMQITKVSKTFKHALSHQLVLGRFIHTCILQKRFQAPTDWLFIAPDQIDDFALPVLLTRYMSGNKLWKTIFISQFNEPS